MAARSLEICLTARTKGVEVLSLKREAEVAWLKAEGGACLRIVECWRGSFLFIVVDDVVDDDVVVVL